MPALLLAAAPPALVPTSPPPDSLEQLHQAHANYEYGDYGAAAKTLEPLTQSRALERTQDQIEAFRLLGLSRFFLNQPDAAVHAFVELLSLDPDFQLDALYVPPQAVAFFESVRRNNKDLLDPIRQRRRATQEASVQEEAARQRFLSLGALAAPRTITQRERIDRPSKVVAIIPGGIGQFQNGNVGLGVTLAVTEAVAIAAWASSYGWIEANSQNGYFSPSTYQTALTLRGVQIGSWAAFAGLAIFGAVEALVDLRPPRIVPEDATEGDDAKSRVPPPAPPKLGFGIAPLPGGAVGSVQLGF